jgi:hypothetical protein
MAMDNRFLIPTGPLDQEEEKNPSGFFEFRPVHQKVEGWFTPIFSSSGFYNPPDR